MWQLCRSGARKRSGGVAVLVHERLGAAVCQWQASGRRQPSPYHFWLRFSGGAIGPNPVFLLAAYLPPYRSPYGLKSSQELEDYMSLLGDEVAEISAIPGAEVLGGMDANGHTGNLPDWEDHAALLEAALEEQGEAAEEVLLPCAALHAAVAPVERQSSCMAAPCAQGKAVLQLCSATGLLIGNGRVQGDRPGQPTCYSSEHTPSVVDIFLFSPSLLSRAAELQVLPAVPEYRVHRPLELWLAPPPPSARQCGTAPTPAPSANPESDCCGPAPSFAAPLRITPDRLSSFANELEQPATAAQLQHLATLASSDPLQAATQLESVLFNTASAVFPTASTRQRQQQAGDTARQLRRRHQPWFDAECEAARRQIRQQMQASLASGQLNHLAKEALRVVSNRYTRLRKRKAAAWQRRQSSALLQLQRTDPRRFFKRWKRRNPSCPIPAPTLLRHFVGLQQRRFFGQPSRGRTTTPAARQAAPASGTSPTRSRSPSPPAPDAELDADISPAEVTAALRKLSPSSASLGPLKAALIKAGGDVLTPVLAALFTAVFRSGCFPPEWALGAITPILKKGDPSDPNNYRGITVGHVLGKLYALVVNARLTAWLEARGKRAKGQTGFRQGHRTVDNCFILRALAERARTRGVKLFCCAVDYEKAFDLLDREEMWAALRRAGVGGTMLLAVQAMYADVPVCVRSEEGLSACFQSVLGVKQGCPLSPLLFGLVLDDFEARLVAALGEAASLPTLAGHVMGPMLFADDTFLIATSAAGLQAQLRFLQTYCEAKKLTVNTAKTQVMILRPGGGNGRPAADETFTYAGTPLSVVSSTKYLGLTFSQLSKQHGFASCADVLAKAGRQAMFAMRRRAWELGARSVEQQCLLFDIFVQPVLSYGCEVWAVDLLSRTGVGSSVERVHRWFCRRIQGLPNQVSSAVALGELGRQPLHLLWVRQLVRFWNRLQASMGEPDRPLGWAFADNLELLRDGSDLAAGSPCWSRRWLQFLQSAPTDTGTLVWLTELNETAVLERAAAAYHRQALQASSATPATSSKTTVATSELRGTRGRVYADLHGTPYSAQDAGHCQPEGCRASTPPFAHAASSSSAASLAARSSKFAFYLDSVRGDVPLHLPAPHLLDPSIPPAHRIALSRFRTSCHDLRIERDRYLPKAVKASRHERTCLMCASTAIEDETHMVFHCPIYDHLRFEYADLFPDHLPPSLACFLSQHQTRVAAFIHDCHILRRRYACMSLAGSESAL